MGSREHWEGVYRTRKPTEVSWYQPEAALSLNLISRAMPEGSGTVIDVGGGSSTLVDGLLARGCSHVTVLDVSRAALAQASERLGTDADRVTWLEADILEARLPVSGFDVWHDRAVFHFLTDAADRRRYVDQALGAVRAGGHVVIATFAGDGPARCSGLDVVRYEPDELLAELGDDFELVESRREAHATPSGARQAFVYCLCRVKGHGAANG
jgi:SAM-dependent methyltransferase